MFRLRDLPRRFAVYDLEFTAWEGSQERGWSAPGEHREVVQIGAVVTDRERDFEEVRSLNLLVRPTVNPTLSSYITNLTGITQADVDARGIAFPEALASLRRFAGEDAPMLVCFGLDAEVLAENCALHGRPLDIPETCLVNVRPAVSALLGRPDGSFASSALPVMLGLRPVGQAHDALGDARAIVAALRHLFETDVA